jgi:hypothetical protein
MILKLGQGFLSIAVCSTVTLGATISSAQGADETTLAPSAETTSGAPSTEPKPVLEETRLDLPPNKPDPFAARKAELLGRIENIKSSGAGVTPFLNQMDEIDALRKANTPDPAVSKRYDSLSHSIDDQISRMQALKQYHPVATPSHIAHGGGTVNSSAFMDAIKQHFGDRIPAGMTDEKLMQVLKNNPKAQQALQGLKIK